MAVQSPVFGMAGTLIGLIQMLMHIDDPSTIGPVPGNSIDDNFLLPYTGQSITESFGHEVKPQNRVRGNIISGNNSGCHRYP